MRILSALTALLILAACMAADSKTTDAERTTKPAAKQSLLPTVDHVVIVVEENHSYLEIIGSKSAPYINQLAKQGANLTSHYAVTHPSQPNYLALFSGSTQGVANDSPMHTFHTDNLAHQLISHGYTFAGYSEGLPYTGYTGPYKLSTQYARKHNPWVDFSNVPSSVNLPMTAFPKQYDKLPTISFVIPNLDHDIHDGTIKEADDWLKSQLSGYVQWAKTHNSMLVVTWDEDDMSANNKIPTLIVGPMVAQKTITQKSSHYSLLRTLEDLYGLDKLGHSEQAVPLDIWKQQ